MKLVQPKVLYVWGMQLHLVLNFTPVEEGWPSCDITKFSGGPSRSSSHFILTLRCPQISTYCWLKFSLLEFEALLCFGHSASCFSSGSKVSAVLMSQHHQGPGFVVPGSSLSHCISAPAVKETTATKWLSSNPRTLSPYLIFLAANGAQASDNLMRSSLSAPVARDAPGQGLGTVSVSVESTCVNCIPSHCALPYQPAALTAGRRVNVSIRRHGYKLNLCPVGSGDQLREEQLMPCFSFSDTKAGRWHLQQNPTSVLQERFNSEVILFWMLKIHRGLKKPFSSFWPQISYQKSCWLINSSSLWFLVVSKTTRISLKVSY